MTHVRRTRAMRPSTALPHLGVLVATLHPRLVSISSRSLIPVTRRRPRLVDRRAAKPSKQIPNTQSGPLCSEQRCQRLPQNRVQRGRPTRTCRHSWVEPHRSRSWT